MAGKGTLGQEIGKGHRDEELEVLGTGMSQGLERRTWDGLGMKGIG